MSNDYQSFRSRFLIFWVFVNAIAGWIVVILSRESHDYYLNVITGVLAFVIFFKFLFSVLHYFSSYLNDWKVNRYLKKERIKGLEFHLEQNTTIKNLFDPFQSKIKREAPKVKNKKKEEIKRMLTTYDGDIGDREIREPDNRSSIYQLDEKSESEEEKEYKPPQVSSGQRKKYKKNSNAKGMF